MQTEQKLRSWTNNNYTYIVFSATSIYMYIRNRFSDMSKRMNIEFAAIIVQPRIQFARMQIMSALQGAV